MQREYATIADYCIAMPLIIDEYGMPTRECYIGRVHVIRNLKASGLEISWYNTVENDATIIRVGARDERLSREAQRIELLVRTQDKYRDNYIPENESFAVYKENERSQYSNSFVKQGHFRFSSLERQRLVYSIMMSPHNEDGADLQELIDDESRHVTILAMFPAHNERELKVLEVWWFGRKNWCSRFSSFLPIKEIRDYFGEEIALSQYFTSCYTNFLKLLFPFGILTFVFTIGQGPDTIAVPIYCIFTAIWATIFLEFWSRDQASVRSEWGVEDFELEEAPRTEYYGDEVTNNITGKKQIVYKPWKRGLKITMSLLVLLVLAGGVIVSTFALIGLHAISNGDLGWVVCGGANFVVIELMNQVYKWIAVRMTVWENHRTQTNHNDALIAKTFVFQFFNSYSSFFYLAFLYGRVQMPFVKFVPKTNEQRMEALGVQLATILMLHILLGQATEMVAPLITKSCAEGWTSFQQSRRICCRHIYLRLKRFWCCADIEEELEEQEQAIGRIMSIYTDEELQQFRPEYGGVLNDYNDMVLQFGYVILFAAAFPLAPLFAYLNNTVELRSDGYKLCKLFRRPHYKCAEDIGSWEYIMYVLSLLAVITNAALLVFTSNALEKVHLLGSNDELARLAVAFMAEHLIFALKILLYHYIPNEPEIVSIRREKEILRAQEDEQDQKANTQEAFEFRQRFVEAPDVFEQHVDLYNELVD